MANYKDYVLNNPDLREHAEAANMTDAQMKKFGETHYEKYGKDEGRLNTPTKTELPEERNAPLEARHYQDRDPRKVLDASLETGLLGGQWEADPTRDLPQTYSLEADPTYRPGTGFLGGQPGIEGGEAPVTPPVTPPVTQPGIDPRMLGGLPGRGVPPGYGGGYGNYPVLGLGTPSGLSYPNAQDAAQGWAGQLGFNIDPRGGLLLRPWEARSWQLSGIDPNLWNAPFAGGGLLGGGYPGGGYIQPGFPSPGPTIPPGWTPSLGGPVPPGGGTVPPGNENGKPIRLPGEPEGWTPPLDFVVDPIKVAGGQGPFMQWTIEQHRLNQEAAARAEAMRNVQSSQAAVRGREIAESVGLAPVTQQVGRAAPPQFVTPTVSAPAVVQPFVDPAAHFQAQQSALAAARAAAATRQKISAYTGAGQAQHEQGLAPGLLGTARSPHVTWT